VAGNDDEEEHLTPWQGLKYGSFMLGVGVFLFILLSLMEDSGRGGRVHWLVAALYYVGGKWTVAGFFGISGLIFYALAYRSYQEENE
jgi:hypothetical protein